MASKWTKNETTLLLELYMKHKDTYRVHAKGKSKVWEAIVKDMQQHGITTCYIKLDRKLRNMKRTYINIKRKNLNAPPNWEYFDYMEQIFGETLNQTIDLTTSEEEETVCEQEMDIKPEPYNVFAHELMDESNFEHIMSDRVKNEEQDVDVDSPYLNLAEELEVQRLEELRVIRLTLQEANTIQRERNQLLQERNELMRHFLATTLNPKKHL